MLKIRRKPFWLSLLAGLALLAVWLLYVPYRPNSLFRAIPTNAALVSIHHNLAARWPAMLRNPLLQSVATSMGVEPAALQSLAGDPTTLVWVRRLAERELIIAYAPRLGGRQAPAWILSSWLGGRSQRLRWQLAWMDVPGLVRHAPHAGTPYWTVQVKELKSGVTLSLALVEGLLIGCLSADPTAILDLLETYDGQRPSLAAVRQAKITADWCLEPAAPDHGWMDLEALRGPAGSSNHLPTVKYSLAAVEAGYARGNVCVQAHWPPIKAGAKPMDAGGLDRLLGDLPLAAALVRSQNLLPVVQEQAGPEWSGLLAALLAAQGADHVMLALVSGDYGGRFYGFRVPALVAALPVQDGPAMLTAVKAALDRLNPRQGWGLIPHEVRLGARSVFAVEGTAQNPFSALPLEERPAYAICDGWLLVSSSLRSLSNLVARYDRPEAAAQAGDGRWMEGLASARGAAYGWMDLARAQKEARLIVATYSLKLLLENPRQSQAQRQQLNVLTAWMDALAPLGQTRLWITSDGQMTALQFEIGRPAR
ncbi:MAG: hypothetical protein NTV49_16690 [Kiritimatiellaeota bacterium]|nr:hypothetical protein [Kiritimatiellota bacterium]